MNDNMVYDSAKVYVTFRRALNAFMQCARTDLRRGKFKKMTQAERAAAGRAFANLQDVAMRARKYFAPEFTEDAWRARAAKYAEEKKLKSVRDAYYIVPSPATIVWDMARDLKVDAALYSEFFRLCDDFMQWEYRREAEDISACYSADRYVDNMHERLAWFEKWNRDNVSVCQKWKDAKRTNPLIKNIVQKVK